MQASSDLLTKVKRLGAVLLIVAWLPGCASGPVGTEASSGTSEPDVCQLAEMEYRVTRTRLDAALGRLERDHGCYFVPSERAGILVGVKLYGVKSRSLPRQVGIRNGDMVAEVNGVPTNTGDAYLRVREKLRHENHFTVKLQRDGQKLTLVVWITNPASNEGGGPPRGCGREAPLHRTPTRCKFDP